MSVDRSNANVDPRDLPLRRNVRLDTLVRIRWFAVLGQSGAVIVVHYGLDFTLPLAPCFAVIALSAALNVAVRVRFRATPRLEDLPVLLATACSIDLESVPRASGFLRKPYSRGVLFAILKQLLEHRPAKT